MTLSEITPSASWTQRGFFTVVKNGYKIMVIMFKKIKGHTVQSTKNLDVVPMKSKLTWLKVYGVCAVTYRTVAW